MGKDFSADCFYYSGDQNVSLFLLFETRGTCEYLGYNLVQRQVSNYEPGHMNGFLKQIHKFYKRRPYRPVHVTRVKEEERKKSKEEQHASPVRQQGSFHTRRFRLTQLCKIL